MAKQLVLEFFETLGEWCSFNIGVCSITHAELWATLLGVQIAWSRGFTHMLVESDSSTVITLVKDGCSDLHNRMHPIVSWQMVVCMSGTKVFREVNQVAYALAKYGLFFQEMLIFDFVPAFLYSTIMADVFGTFFPLGL